ncbi:MAG: hypothetical protein ABR583_07840 [Gaiellaceae bacterium]
MRVWYTEARPIGVREIATAVALHLVDLRPFVEEEAQQGKQALLRFEFVLGGVHAIRGRRQQQRRRDRLGCRQARGDVAPETAR